MAIMVSNTVCIHLMGFLEISTGVENVLKDGNYILIKKSNEVEATRIHVTFHWLLRLLQCLTTAAPGFY